MPEYVSISKEVEFDAAHRVPTHASKCKHLHGHRYRVQVRCVGTIIDDPGSPDDGMLIDFGDLKKFMMEEIHDRFDHRTIVFWKDTQLLATLRAGDFIDSVRTIDYIPTAENLARLFWELLDLRIADHFRDNLQLEEVAVWETPTSVAYYNGTQPLPEDLTSVKEVSRVDN